MLTKEQYEKYIKEQRQNTFITPYNLAYKSFVALGFDSRPIRYFIDNASGIVEEMRRGCWDLFKIEEETFTTNMLKTLVLQDKDIAALSGVDAAAYFAERYPNHIYALSLSNTQSRRSRAGKEFEAIIELVLLGAGVQIDSQGNIGKKSFQKKGLGKLVDLVSPGVVEYSIDKNNTVLISAKTTLRERWQEVPEEMQRTGASKMYLVTLDNSISASVLDIMYESNIILVTTKNIKESFYRDNVHVISFERLIANCLSTGNAWNDYHYKRDEKELIIDHLTVQKNKHADHPFVRKYYQKRINQIMNP